MINQEGIAHDFLVSDANYIIGDDRRRYRCNVEGVDIFYCENNIIIDTGKIIDKYAKNPERYIVMDYFILDKKNKTISLYEKEKVIKDSFINSINSVGEIINITNSRGYPKLVEITYKDNKKIYITLNINNSIIGYQNDYIEEIDDDFLQYNSSLKNIVIPNVVKIGDDFLSENQELISLELPKVRIIGDDALMSNNNIKEIIAPNVIKIGRHKERIIKLLKENNNEKSNHK